jgi:hypothetical protein
VTRLPDRRTLVAATVGLALAAGYVGTVLVAGAHDVLVRRPLLDGILTPQPYNWVRPPPALRKDNKPPSSGTFAISIAPRTGSPAKLFTTKDLQASITLAQGAIKPTNGDSSATLTVTPMAPRGFPSPTGGATVAGNVYRFQGVLEPSRTVLTRFRIPGQVVLAYPAPPTRTGWHHVLLYSPDGRQPWAKIEGIDSPTQQLVQADANGPGYFAVGQIRESGASGGGRSYGNLIVTLVVILIVAAIVIGIVVSEIRMRSRRAETEWRGDGGTGRRGTEAREAAARSRKRRRRRR